MIYYLSIFPLGALRRFTLEECFNLSIFIKA